MMRGAPSGKVSVWSHNLKSLKQFSKQSKTDALIRTSGKSVPQVCRDLDLADSVVRRWLTQPEIEHGRRAGLTTAEREELNKLRKEVRVLREERDILKQPQPTSLGRRPGENCGP